MQAKHLLFKVSSISALLAVMVLSMTSRSAAKSTQDLGNDLDAMLSRLTQAKFFMGSVLVVKDGKPILNKGYGMANQELDVPNTPQTKFRIGSLTKQFTAMGILQLQQAGKLDVQDLICKYLQNCPTSWQKITIYQLLTHTSGIRSFSDLSEYATFKRSYGTAQSVADRLINLPLDFNPGQKWSYSNSNYVLLGLILEKVSGQPYGSYLKTKILEPAGLKDSGVDITSSLLKNRAAGYLNANTNADYIHLSTSHAAGAMYSTTEDLWRWSESFYGEKLLSKQLLLEMTKPRVKMEYPRPDAYYGYGLIIDKAFGHRRIGHIGGNEGFRAGIDWFPDDRIAIVVLSNREDIDPIFISDLITKQIFASTQ